MHRILAPALMTMLLSACGEVKDTRPGQPVAHRQAAFKEILEVFEPIGGSLKKEPLDAAGLQALARQLLAKREAPWAWFAPDTLYPPSKAKVEVWSEAGKFEAARKDFFEATDRLAEAADRQDRKELEASYASVRDSCKRCHQAFKER